MSRKPTIIDEKTLMRLRDLIQSKSNLKCNSFADIQILQTYILKGAGKYLSVQTLNRFFGVIRSDFNPSVHTLNILSQYVDYKSFDSFEAFNKHETLFTAGNSLFVSEFFITMFSGIKVSNNNDQGLEQLAMNLLRWMKRNNHLTPDIYSGLATTALGRKLFFEQFVNIDALNNGFGEGLNYYLLHYKEKEHRIFAYSMYCYRYFLSGDLVMFRKYFELIRQEHFDISRFSKLVVDRYYATIILNQAVTDREHDGSEVLLHDYDMLSSSVKSFSDSCFHVGEALLFVGEFQMAWEILSNNCSKALDIPECLKSEFELQVRILKLLSGILSGNISTGRAGALYKEFSGNPLPFLAENYLSIFLQFIRYKVNAKPAIQRDASENLDGFIRKTGFYYFEKYYSDYIK